MADESINQAITIVLDKNPEMGRRAEHDERGALSYLVVCVSDELLEHNYDVFQVTNEQITEQLRERLDTNL